IVNMNLRGEVTMTEAITDFIHRSNPDEVFPLVLIFGGSAVVAIVAIVAAFIYASKKRDSDAALKHEMIARGMSADEIQQVLSAKPTAEKVNVGYRSRAARWV